MLLAALASVVIASCYDGDTCITTTGERFRLACIDTPELRGKRAKLESATAARDHLRWSSGGQEGRNPTGYQRSLWANGGRTIRWKNKCSEGDGRQRSRRGLLEICQPMLMDKQRLMRLQSSTESILALLHTSWQGPTQRSSNLHH